MKSEIYFNRKRDQVAGATSMAQLLQVLTEDLDPRIPGQEYKRSLQRGFNKQFRGNVEKARQASIKQLNESEYHYDQYQMIQWQTGQALQSVNPKS